MEHEDVGLLDELRGGYLLVAQEHVDRDGWVSELRDEARFQLEVAGELLVDAKLRAKAIDESFGEPAPPGCFFIRAGALEQRRARSQVPARHDVCVRVVVDDL